MNNSLYLIFIIAITISLTGLAFGWVYLYGLKKYDKGK